MQNIGSRIGNHVKKSNKSDTMTPFVIAHSLLQLVKSNHKVMPNNISASRMQVAIVR